MNGPKTLRSLLAGWRPAGERAQPGGEAGALAAAWPDAVGADVARRTRTSTYRDGTLAVITPSSAWSHQLTFLAPTIIERLRERCPGIDVRRLKFSVATGRSRALLAGAAGAADPDKRSARPELRSGTTGATGTQALDKTALEGDDIAGLVAQLRREQTRLDRRRAQDGWQRCASCGNWSPGPARGAGAMCGPCAEELRRADDGKIAHVLTVAPWLGRAEVAVQLPALRKGGYERVRRGLLTSWEQQLYNARARLRRGALEAADRVTAWSYVMMVAQRPQSAISKAVVSDVLGLQWADALHAPPPARKAPRPAREKLS
jgi:hypothetical protein